MRTMVVMLFCYQWAQAQFSAWLDRWRRRLWSRALLQDVRALIFKRSSTGIMLPSTDQASCVFALVLRYLYIYTYIVEITTTAVYGF